MYRYATKFVPTSINHLEDLIKTWLYKRIPVNDLG